MRIAIATDAWFPQINGVVRSLAATVTELQARGHEVELITPQHFRTMAMPGYREIRLAMMPRFGTRTMLGSFQPEVVHIVTEGPIGWSARSWCKAHQVPFTSAFHTRFPDYAAVRTGLDAERFWPIMRRFHAPSRAVLVSTPSLAAELNARGLPQTQLWSRGIDPELFQPIGLRLAALADLPRPILLNVGRIALEKNLEAFLSAPVAGTKVVVGDGPALADLRARFPDVIFTGALSGEDLAAAYRAADLFVFPSRTDTFGLVMIEALACGVPVAGFAVPGPLDVIGTEGRGPDNEFPLRVGAVADNLPEAIARALQCDRQAAAVFGARHSWMRATDQFITALQAASATPRERELEPA